MNKLFIIQLIVSFIVGGGVIALLSFIAEKTSKRIAGIILAFPTTVALGFMVTLLLTKFQHTPKEIFRTY